MNVTVKIFFSDNIYTPACYFCNVDAAWQLWFSLTCSMQKGISGPHVEKVELWDGGSKLEPEKGKRFCLNTQYTGI